MLTLHSSSEAGGLSFTGRTLFSKTLALNTLQTSTSYCFCLLSPWILLVETQRSFHTSCLSDSVVILEGIQLMNKASLLDHFRKTQRQQSLETEELCGSIS